MLVAQNVMSIVDLHFVGHLGPEVSGAMSLGLSQFSWVLVVGIGLLSGSDYLIAHALGQGNPALARAYARYGMKLALLLSLPCMFVVWLIGGHIGGAGISFEVAHRVDDFLRVLLWSFYPFFQIIIFRICLQAQGKAESLMWIFVAANILNFIFNPILIARFGIQGSALSTVICRVFIAGAGGFALYSVYKDKGLFGVRVEPVTSLNAKMTDILKLGLPAAGQLLFEVGFFSLGTFLVGKMPAFELAAHGVVLGLASCTFMIPLGIAGSLSIKVGEAVGAKNHARVISLSKSGIGLAVMIMSISALIMCLFPHLILDRFTSDPRVLYVGRRLLMLAGLFQIFDGLQAVLTGILRGTGNTKSAMYANIVGHWLVGLPMCLLLGFRFRMNATGIWIGLAVGLATVAMILLVQVRRTLFRLREAGGHGLQAQGLAGLAEAVPPK